MLFIAPSATRWRTSADCLRASVSCCVVHVGNASWSVSKKVCSGSVDEQYNDTAIYGNAYLFCRGGTWSDWSTEDAAWACNGTLRPTWSEFEICSVNWAFVDGLNPSGLGSILVCSGEVGLGVIPSCSSGWTTTAHVAPFSVSQIDPAVAGAFFGSGFFLCVVPLAAAWGFSQLLNMITGR